jgi:5'-methylthioadenosine phosphorylase
MKPVHRLASKDDIAKNVRGVGDPGRAKLLSDLLKTPKLVNENRGFITYTGLYQDVPITVATHGIGSASSAAVFEELRMLGAERMVRLGTTGAFKEEIKVGDVIVADGAAHPIGGTIGMYIGTENCYPASPDIELTYEIYKKLKSVLPKVYLGGVFSSDAFYAENPQFVEIWSHRNILSVEMECATLFTIARLRGFKAGGVLVVSDNLKTGESVLAQPEILKTRFLEVGKTLMDVFIMFEKKP